MKTTIASILAILFLCTILPFASADIVPTVTDKPEVRIELIEKEKLSAEVYGGDTELEYANYIRVMAGEILQNVTLGRVDCGIDENGRMIFRGIEPICSVPELFPNESVVFAADLGEVLPIRSISVTDNFGNCYDYLLGLSGMDGSLILEQLGTAEAVIAEEYRTVFDSYSACALAKWDPETAEANGVSALYARHIQEDTADRIGYYLTDMDRDGQLELIIGCGSDEPYFNALAFAVYTIRDGEPAEVAVSSERSRWYMTFTDSMIHEYSQSAFEYGCEHMTLTDGQPDLIDGYYAYPLPERQCVIYQRADSDPVSADESFVAALLASYDAMKRMPELIELTE